MTALLESLGIINRSGVETFIERLIAMLDDYDGDSDFEPEPLEPYLSGSHTDREYGDDNGIADGDGLVEQVPGWGGRAE